MKIFARCGGNFFAYISAGHGFGVEQNGDFAVHKAKGAFAEGLYSKEIIDICSDAVVVQANFICGAYRKGKASAVAGEDDVAGEYGRIHDGNVFRGGGDAVFAENP